MNCIDYWMDFGVYAKDEIEEFAKIFFNLKEKPEKMQPMLDKVVDVWKSKAEDEREDFRSTLQSFIRLYGFMSQLITFVDVDLEKLYVFSKNLNRESTKRKNRLCLQTLYCQSVCKVIQFKIAPAHLLHSIVYLLKVHVRMICESVGQTPDKTRNHVRTHSLIYQSVY